MYLYVVFPEIHDPNQVPKKISYIPTMGPPIKYLLRTLQKFKVRKKSKGWETITDQRIKRNDNHCSPELEKEHQQKNYTNADFTVLVNVPWSCMIIKVEKTENSWGIYGNSTIFATFLRLFQNKRLIFKSFTKLKSQKDG